MSLEAVDAFRQKINESPSLQAEATEALNTSLASVVALGATHGYNFTESEADQALAKYMTDGELSDYEMELVSAGSSCTNTGGTGISKNT